MIVTNTKQKDAPETFPLRLRGESRHADRPPVLVAAHAGSALDRLSLATLEALAHVEAPDGVKVVAWREAAEVWSTPVAQSTFYKKKDLLEKKGLVTPTGSEPERWRTTTMAASLLER
jgi:hypothetical protein